MKNSRKTTVERLFVLGRQMLNMNLLFALVLLLTGGADAQYKPEKGEKAAESSGILDDASNRIPMYMQPATAVGDALDISTKPRDLSVPQRIEGIEGVTIIRDMALTGAYIKGDSGKPEMKSAKFKTTVAFGQVLIKDSASHSGKGSDQGLYSFYRLPPKAPFVFATQGNYPDRVEISWRFDVLSPAANVDFFEVKRDGEIIASLPVTESLYKDFNAQPGRYYQYEVAGKNKYGVGAAGSEVGFVNPNGTITGRIMTKNGAPVKDVEVLMTPNLGKSLYMNGTDNYVSVGNNMDFRDTSFTFEFWLKHNAGEGGVFACGSVNNDVSIDMVQGKMWFDMGTAVTNINHSPDGQWHHYAFVWDNVAKKAFIYKDSALVNTTQAPANHRINISGLPAYLGKTLYSSALFNGNIDELRLWRGARDQGSILRNMYRSVSTQTPNLEAYWRMDEGKGNKIFDFASKKHSGTVSGPIVFMDDRAPIRNTTFTDNTGYYIAEGINYGTSTNFTVFPSRPGRIFTPENRLVTLSMSNTAVNNLDFTDISQIPVSGKITNNFQPTCLNDTTVEILVDDSSWTPRTFANSSGEYILEFEPGSSHKIKPSRKGYVFTPGFFQFDSIRAPLAQKNFTQMKSYNLTVQVSGGQCELALGGTSRVKITPVPACGTFSLTQDITGTDKTTTFNGLGPAIYKIEVTRPTGDIIFEADTVDLRDTSRIKKITYYAPLQVVAELPSNSGISNFTCDTPPIPLLEQLKQYRLKYTAFEMYNGVKCLIKGSKIYITNEIADENILDSLETTNGAVVDSFEAGYPNPLGGGAHAYQKQILLRAVDSLGRESQPVSFWAIVTGVKPRPGQTFASTSPEMPMVVLRQPPGDQSFSFLSQTQTVSNSFSLSVSKGKGTQRNYMISLAPYFESETGIGFSIITNLTPIAQTYGVMNTYHNNVTTNTLATTMEVNETISTQNVAQTSGYQGDVFAGVAYNIVFGLTDSVYYRADSCGVRVKTGVIVAPDSIKTKFIYTEDYVRTVQIPNLYTLGTRRDSTAAKNWVRFLERNDSLKASTADSVANISFTAGATYSYSKSFTRDTTFSWYDELPSDSAFGFIAGVFAQGVGGQGGGEFNFSYNIGKTWETTVSRNNTVGYTLADDDQGDGFTVDIANDKVYGTPVFRTRAGQSSCPYEPGTFERDKAVFPVRNVAASNVHPDSTVIWPIRLGNNSSTDETRDYTLRVLNETNPNGLIIAVNGIIIQNSIMFTLPKGTVQTMLMVKRSANIYSYNNIKLVLSPMCDNYGQADSQSDTLTIQSVNYLRPCSPVAITAPLDNWLVNSFSDNRLGVTIAGYDTNNTDFTQVKLQYRRPVGPNRPFGGFARNAIASLDGDDMVPRFDLTGYPVEQFPKRVNLNTLYANTLDSYDASQEDRFSLLTGPMYENTYRNIVLKGYAAMHSPKSLNTGALASKQQKTSAADGEEGNSTITPDNPENLWVNFKILPKDSLSRATTPGYYNAVWLNSGLDEGAYQIRAITSCNGSTIEATSAILNGLIDKTGPSLQGMPEPASGILTLTDQIGITFSEDVLPSTAIKGNTVNLYYSSGPQAGQQLDFNFACNGRTIIITPNIADRFIENNTLRAVVKKIKDVNGNFMRIPLGTAFIDSVSWEFVVQKSPVRWTGGDITITKYADETVQVTRELKNISGFPNSYYLRNIPAWLGVSTTSGIVPNQGNVPVTFTFGTNIASGAYDVTVTDSTIYGDQPLRIRLVNACRPPQYTVNPANFEFSMNIIGKLFIGANASTDVNDKVGVFVGQQARGTANVLRLPDGQYRVFVTVYSNQQSGEKLTVRVWDSSACNEYGQTLESFTFSANSILGTYDAPASITASTQVLQPYKFANGWTWISFNATRPDMSVTSILTGLHPADGDVIKYRDKYAQYVPASNFWFGLLDTIRPGQGYLMRLAAKDSLTVTGVPVTPSALKIKLDAGWNYLGYAPQSGMSVNAALATLHPTAGDLVKSQFAFATFTATNGWVGNLFTMEPRLGYFMKLAKKDSLTYPNSPPAAAPLPQQQNEFNPVLAENPDWNVQVNNYQYTMSVIAELGSGILDTVSDNTVIGVFADNICRGFARPMFINGAHPKMFFLTVYSNAPSGEQLSFRVYDGAANRTFALNSRLGFTPDGVLGSIDEPYMVTGSPLDVKDGRVIPAQYELSQNYPNPFNPTTTIAYALPKEGSVRLVIYNIMGEAVRTLLDDTKSAGYYSAQWDGRNNAGSLVPSGIYLYSIQSGDFSSTKKLTLLK